MRSAAVSLVLGACSFSTTVEPAACTSDWWDDRWAQRFAIATDAPAGYTARIDASAVLASSSNDDVRVVVDNATELDRVIDGSFVEFRVPSAGTLALYTGNAEAGAPPADPSAVYTWSESFDAMPIGADGSPRFLPQTPVDWRVADDAGNRVYRAGGPSRHPAPISGLTFANVEVRARIRVGPAGGVNHDGLLVRASNVVPGTLDGFVGQVLEDSEYSRIAEYIDGVSPPIERGTHLRPVNRATWYAMRMKAVGNVLELYVDGVLEVTTTLGTNNGTTLGLFAHDPDVDYDDVRVRQLIDPEPATTLGAREDRVCRADL